MTQPSRNRNLLFIIVVLILTNIAVLVYFLGFRKPPEHRSSDRGRNGLTEMLQKEVGFNDSQVAQYKTLKDQQWNNLKPLFDNMRLAKDSLFRLMSDSTVNDSTISRAADGIAARQRSLDLMTFDHFRRVRALCNSRDQQVKYDSAIFRMFRKMGKPPVKKAEGDKDDKKSQ